MNARKRVLKNVRQELEDTWCGYGGYGELRRGLSQSDQLLAEEAMEIYKKAGEKALQAWEEGGLE